ncbi:hypothetical protein PLICRDRAFT_44911 [Plicaturopsis crispa FD-325 SS-3]|nr:hypothetical protein PLICRDRAFT_44911 [Plicaturopsis crispa FD-325 SS-3]
MSSTEPCHIATRDYVQQALLPIVVHTNDVPPMPEDDCRSEYHPRDGYMHPGGYHYLQRIHRYDQCLVERHINQFNESIARRQLTYNTDNGEDLTIHVDGVVEEIPPGLPKRVEATLLGLRYLKSDENLVTRTEMTILETATTIYHQLFPSVAPTCRFWRYKAWGIQYEYMTPFVFADWNTTISCTNSKMAVFVVPPWYLAPRDMRDFVNIREFKRVDSIKPGVPPSMEEKRQHYWAMVNDFCFIYKV